MCKYKREHGATMFWSSRLMNVEQMCEFIAISIGDYMAKVFNP